MSSSATSRTVPKYRHKDPLGFYPLLKKRVDQHFLRNGLSRKGGKKIVFKTILLFLLYGASYYGMISQRFQGTGIFACALVFGITNVLLVFNVGHDAAHNALFQSTRINRILSYTFNLVGANAYLWNITHNEIHHAFPNVGDFDGDIHQQAPFIRISPTVKRKWYHRYQPYYATPIYMIYSIFLVFQKDYQDIGLLPKKDSRLLDGRRHQQLQWILFLFSKLTYYCLTILLPLLLIPVSGWQFLLGFLTVHFVMSLILAAVLIPVHMVNEAPFALEQDGFIEDNWALHVMKNTTDYAANSRLANWLFGGLNTHLAHHLFPGIAHVHYRAVSRIVRETALELGLEYRNVSMAAAIASHYRLLKRMS